MKKPVNEMGVVSLFAQYCQTLGYVIMEIRAPFPDVILYEISTGNLIKAEFEYKSKNFKLHKHDQAKCDLIICWENNWSECPLPTIELKDYHTDEPIETVYDIQEKSKKLRSEYESQKLASHQLGRELKGLTAAVKETDKKRILFTQEVVKDAIDNSNSLLLPFNDKKYNYVGIFRCKNCGTPLTKIYVDDYDDRTFVISEDKKIMIFGGIFICGCGRKTRFRPLTSSKAVDFYK